MYKTNNVFFPSVLKEKNNVTYDPNTRTQDNYVPCFTWNSNLLYCERYDLECTYCKI